ncbi:MAG: FtsX-like permease family protein [Treponema sp.]|jgi:ABC-type lipoprotein release transport system permease subunit|nr:FtsX-like permease family protein [Treponema sp.]
MKLQAIWELKRMAFRNLARHKVKTTLSILAIAVSVAVYIFMDSWMVGMIVDSERNIVSYETGAAKLQTKMYFEKLDDRPMYENFDNWEQYAEALDRAGFDAAPHFVFTGTLYSETGAAPVVFNAVDPVLDPKVLRVSEALDAGRYLKSGAFEIILGNMTADKLKVGLPMRPTRGELEGEILPQLPPSEHDFVRGLYQPVGKKSGSIYASKKTALPQGEELSPERVRLLIKRDLSQADKDRYWALLAETGRMNVRISTVIDIKAPPDSIRQDKFEADLAPALSAEEMGFFKRVYEYDELTGAWHLIDDDPVVLGELLQAMVRIDYSGAIRHVNQLISAVVVGTINAPNPQLNNNMAFIPLDALQDDAGLMLDGHVTELIVRQKKADDSRIPGLAESAPVIKTALEKELGAPLPSSLDVFGWEGYARDFIAASAGDNWTTRIIAVILFILSFLGIANTMLLAILERTKEIGMMRAQGMTDGQLVFTLMIEAGMVGIIGSAIGILAGCLVNIPMVEYGIDFSAMTETMGGNIGYRVNGVFRSAWNVPVIIATGIVATILSAVMAFFPTRRALKMPVTESLRFE